MKQTQTHLWSLAGEEAVSYSLARGKAAAVTRESGEVAAYSGAWRGQYLALAAPGQRENTETVAKLPQPAQPRYHAWGARPEDHVITNYLFFMSCTICAERQRGETARRDSAERQCGERQRICTTILTRKL